MIQQAVDIAADVLRLAFAGPVGLRCALILGLTLGLSLLLLPLLVRAIIHLRTQSVQPVRVYLRSESGTVTIEFALVFPILLTLGLLLLQTMLVMAGNIMIHHAAFAAARSAIVQIPRDLPEYDEPANQIFDATDSAKRQIIRKAAVWALVGVSGRWPAGATPVDTFTQGLSEVYTGTGQAVPAWINAQAGARLRYADAHTSVRMLVVQSDSPGSPIVVSTVTDRVSQLISQGRLDPDWPSNLLPVGPRDPITVEVEHKLVLSIPVACWFFSSGRHAGSGPGGPGDNSRSYYSTVTAQCTLPNEGLSAAMPLQPTITRNP
jgi:hypothetical protein